MDIRECDRANLLSAVKACASSAYAGSLLSTSKAIGEFRMLSGDFVTADDELANILSQTAVAMGCTVVFDERTGADTLNMTDGI